MGDGILIAIVDTATRSTEGDFYKLPNYYNKAEDSPIAGYIVVVVIYIFFIILNIMIFYNYIIYVHLNGRLQDIYVRLQGDPRVFFSPHDNELSLRHLLWCYYTAIVNSQRIVVNHIQIINDYGEPCTVSTLQTSNYISDVSLEVARTFIKDEIGCIKELCEKEISFLNTKESLTLTSLLSKVPTNKSRDFYTKIGGVGGKNLALMDIDAANPYHNKYANDRSGVNSRATIKRRSSLARRIGSARSNKSLKSHKSIKSKFKRSETNRSKKTSRRGSLRSKKSLASPSNKIGRRHTVKRRQTSKEPGTMKGKMEKQFSGAEEAKVNMSKNDSILSPQKISPSKFKSEKFL
jgi:hypothetical protein